MQKVQQFHVLDRILHHRNKHHICYYNSRAIKFGPTLSFLQGRTRFEEKIAPQLKTKRKLLIDEQIIQFKMMIRGNQKNTDQLIRFGDNTEDLPRLKELRCQAQQLFKDFYHLCRQRSFILQRHERDLSEPKYKQTTIPNRHKRQSFKKFMGFSYLEDSPFYFLSCYKDLQNKIIFCRQAFSLFTSYKEDNKLASQTEELWMQLITCLQESKNRLLLNEFSPVA